MTSFSDLLAQLDAAPDGSRLEVSEDWTQGRTLFGGLTAAFCVAKGERVAAEGHDGPLPPLRSGQFAFVGPASGPLKLSGEVLRRGKSTVFVQVDLVGEAGLATRALLTFGAARQSSMDDEDLPAPSAPGPEDSPLLHGSSGGPSFVRHFDIRSADGVPLRPTDPDAPRPVLRPDLLLWARHRDEAAGFGPAALMALADIPPPAAMRLMTRPGPISTMTWMVDLMAPPPLAEDAGWRLLRSTAQITRSGYSSQSMSLWDQAGRPLVIGRQNVAVFS
ncbi:MAG: thioesterase family protein [Caulobacteraceae bacterium]|jgi:acyl-CoA thioesterase|nr:thioesterase family protein [Caulobacteraceae bacterium]